MAEIVPTRPIQTDATQLKATITPSGDMARQHWYDRNPMVDTVWWGGALAAEAGYTVVWSYTVPTGRKAMHTVCWTSALGVIATAGRDCSCSNRIWDPETADYRPYHELRHMDTTTEERATKTTTITFLMAEGDTITGTITNTDTVDHWMGISATLTEFDA